MYYKITGEIKKPHSCGCYYCKEEWEDAEPLIVAASGSSPSSAQRNALMVRPGGEIWAGQPLVEPLDVPDNGCPVFLINSRQWGKMGDFVTNGYLAIHHDLVNVVAAIPERKGGFCVPSAMQNPALKKTPLKKGDLWFGHVREYKCRDGSIISLEEEYVKIFEGAGLLPYLADNDWVILFNKDGQIKGLLVAARA